MGAHELVAAPGDRLVVRGRRRDRGGHCAEVVEVLGPDGRPPYRVRWEESGVETLAHPGPGTRVEHGAGAAFETRAERYEIWQLFQAQDGKRFYRFLASTGTVAEANTIVDAIARAGVSRESLVVQDTTRHRWFRRRRPR